jgi:hypothetical protein
MKDGPEPLKVASHSHHVNCLRMWLEYQGSPQDEIDAIVMDMNLLRWEKIWKR